MNAITEIITGAAALTDWLGDGGHPVDPMVSEARAKCCENCIQNMPGRWWESAKHEIAEWIRTELELKNKREIKTTIDDKLGMCRLCGCCIRLKVHTPKEHIAAHISKEVLDQTPSHCWMRKEILNTP